jgi:hypothetical protein
MTPTQTLLVTFAVTIIGSGLGTSIVAALLNKRFGTQLEAHKALLLRSGRIHERQVDALLKIHSKLDEALFYLQRVASAGRIPGEASDKELFGRAIQSLADASTEFSKNKLLISETLGQKLNEFFDGVVAAGIDFNLILDPMLTNPDERAKLWDALRDAAYRKLPSVLKAIRDDARAVIHG